MKTEAIIGIVIIIILLAGGLWFLGISKDIENSIGSGDTGVEGNSGEGGPLNLEDLNSELGPFNVDINLEIVDFAFEPDEITIELGDRITWTNYDEVEHTVTSDSGSELDSALLGKGESYSHIFNKVGIFNYHCTPHPDIKGKIIVEETQIIPN